MELYLRSRNEEKFCYYLVRLINSDSQTRLLIFVRLVDPKNALEGLNYLV